MICDVIFSISTSYKAASHHESLTDSPRPPEGNRGWYTLSSAEFGLRKTDFMVRNSEFYRWRHLTNRDTLCLVLSSFLLIALPRGVSPWPRITTPPSRRIKLKKAATRLPLTVCGCRSLYGTKTSDLETLFVRSRMLRLRSKHYSWHLIAQS